jgi:hypothetical protein
MRFLVWRKSTFSGNENCVEIALTPGGFAVRDSKDPDGAVLAFAQSPSGPPSIVRATAIMHTPKAV